MYQSISQLIWSVLMRLDLLPSPILLLYDLLIVRGMGTTTTMSTLMELIAISAMNANKITKPNKKEQQQQ